MHAVPLYTSLEVKAFASYLLWVLSKLISLTAGDRPSISSFVELSNSSLYFLNIRVVAEKESKEERKRNISACTLAMGVKYTCYGENKFLFASYSCKTPKRLVAFYVLFIWHSWDLGCKFTSISSIIKATTANNWTKRTRNLHQLTKCTKN